MKTLWFRNKTYGYGWYPCSWQGWVVLAAYIVFLCAGILTLSSPVHSEKETLVFVGYVLVLTVILLGICLKTGEKLEWRWGPKKDDTKQ